MDRGLVGSGRGQGEGGVSARSGKHSDGIEGWDGFEGRGLRFERVSYVASVEIAFIG